MDSQDDCIGAALGLEEMGYGEDFCLALDFDPLFLARCMAGGFLVMSCLLFPEDHEEKIEPETEKDKKFILLLKHHLVRSCLFFPELHIKKSIKKYLPLYDLYFDKDFDRVFDKCLEIHGDGWLTEPLAKSIREIRKIPGMPVRPVSFALYRKDRLVAGEFGIVSGRVYTSYSGYYEEDNAGTVQMILSSRYLEKNNFSFWDLGMVLDYKRTLGSREISRGEFLELFLKA